ncbi:MAG: sigma 54-interacting transcriptional regulator [Firmicutes bacterium]|nr:sigma 54-interacting transcriptional regulator [Bacillota bacterium]
MARVGVITKFPLFARYFDEMEKYFPDDEVKVYLGNETDDVMDLLDAAERDGCAALVTGAFTYEDLVDRTYLPIVDVEADFQDIINAWTKVKQRGIKPSRVAVFLVHSNPVLRYESLEEELSVIFDADVRIVKYSTRSEYEPLMNSLKSEVDLIIAGEKSIEVCRKYDIPNEFMELGLNNKMSGVEQALSIARAEIESRARNKRLQEIINFSEEGIILLDREARIVEYNRTASKILNMGSSIRVQKFSVWDVFPENDFDGRKEDLFSLDNEILKLKDGRTLVISTKLLEVGKNVEGAIITVRETKEIEEIERKIRKKENDRGNVAKYDLSSIIGVSSEIKECKNLLRRFGKFDGNVLITGETGTGKELFAQSIHNESVRKNEPFFAINCAALPASILESELFGYSEGSFTGAAKGGKPGIFELAHGGTLYLDEITEMDLSCQSKLLRVIQEREVRRVGDSKIIPVDVRIIAASNRDIWQEVVENRFREDLYYRLNIMTIKAPPLRERKADIMILIDYFKDFYGEKYGGHFDIRFTRRAEEYLRNYPWHGNVRELQNFVERLYVYGYNGVDIDVSAISGLIHEFKQGDYRAGTLTENDSRENKVYVPLQYEEKTIRKRESIREIEMQAILDALEEAGGNKTKAAEMLGMSRTTLWRRLAEK